MLLFSVLLIVFILILLIIRGTAGAAFLVNSTISASVCEVISRIAFVAVMRLMLIVFPRIREVFPGFGMELP